MHPRTRKLRRRYRARAWPSSGQLPSCDGLGLTGAGITKERPGIRQLAGMKAVRPWHRRFIRSMQQQLQLASSGVMILGFAVAAGSTLWIGNFNLQRELARDAKQVKEALNRRGEELMLLPVAERNRLLSQLRRNNTNWKQTVWIELDDGTKLLPSQAEGSVPADLVWRLVSTNQPGSLNRIVHSSLPDGVSVVSMVEPTGIPGIRLGIAQNITAYTRALGQHLTLLVISWGITLLLSLRLIGVLVSRIVKPLRQLSRSAATLKSDSLPSGSITVGNAPEEVAELSESYNSLLDRLSEAWQQQRLFVSAVSHELRTPLTIISGYLNRTLRRGTNLNEQQHKAISVAGEECTRLIHLLNDLLDLSRSDSGQLQMTRESFDPRPVVLEAIEQATNTLEHPISFHTDVKPDDDLVMEACPERLKQVLLNLIENAHKYSAADAPIGIELSSEDISCCLAITDNGDGIAVGDLPHIFERFYRGKHSKRSGGSGLGLAVVKLLVEAMGGEISVQSSVGEGSCFTLRFPLPAKQPGLPAAG